MTKVNVIIRLRQYSDPTAGREAALKSRGYAVERVRVGKLLKLPS